MFQKLYRGVVYACLFLIPIFTLPFTSNVLDFQKQFLLLGLTIFGSFFWMWDVFNSKKLNFNLNPLHFFVGLFVAAALISSIFSLYSYGSFWGVPLPVTESFVTVLSFALLYLLVANNFKKGEIYSLVATIAVSGALAVVYGILQAFGLYLLPFLNYSTIRSFNTVGMSSGLGLLAAVLLVVLLPLLFNKKNPYALLMKICSGIFLFAIVFFNGVVTILLPARNGVVNFDLLQGPWVILAVGALATLLFSLSDKQFYDKSAKVKNASFVILLIAVIFMTFNASAKEMVFGVYNSAAVATGVQIEREASLGQGAAMDIAVKTLRQSAQSFFLGSGPGTFVYDYIKFKPQAVSQDNLSYNLTFLSATSELINRATTTGLIGLIAFLAIIIVWTIKGFKMLTGEEDRFELPLAIFGGWLGIVAVALCYPFNMTLGMIFWLLMGLIIILDEERLVTIPLKSVRLTYAVFLIFVGVLVLELGLMVWSAKRYYAEAQYLEAIKALQGKDLNKAISSLEVAANSTDRLQDNYLTGLSQIYLEQAREELNKQDAKPEDSMKAAAPYIKTAISAATLSTDAANPNNVNNWATRGYIYRQLIGISDGFDNWALDMYQKALTLEPANPSLWTEIGQVYILRKDLTKAKESFSKSIELRPQSIDPHYYLAMIFDQEGNKEGAIREFETIEQFLPQDDKTSRENVAKAIDNLKAGKSLGGDVNAVQANQESAAAPIEQQLPVKSENPEKIEGQLPEVPASSEEVKPGG